MLRRRRDLDERHLLSDKIVVNSPPTPLLRIDNTYEYGPAKERGEFCKITPLSSAWSSSYSQSIRKRGAGGEFYENQKRSGSELCKGTGRISFNPYYIYAAPAVRHRTQIK